MSSEHSDHKQRMKRIDDAFESRMAKQTEEKGLLIVYTGNGKGKTTAALGMALRALGHGQRVGIVQFIKGDIQTGEASIIEQLDLPIEIHVMGEGFTWKTQDRERDVAAARRGWDKAVQLLRDPSCDLVIMDELNIVLKYEYLPLQEVLDELGAKREMLHVIVTGRGSPSELVDLADLVSEVKPVKHPFKKGIKPQAGIEF